MTSIVSIYQASELLYSLFDKVCVIYEGRMVYFGPADTARAYFTDMGWEAPMRQTTADFLVSVTDPNGRAPRPGFEHRVPRTADEFAERFRQTALSLANRGEIFSYLTEMGHDIPRSLLETNRQSARSSRSTYDEKARITSAYVESARAEHASHTFERSSYTISVPMQVRAVIQRRIQIIKGSWLTLAVQIMWVKWFILRKATVLILCISARIRSKVSSSVPYSFVHPSTRMVSFLEAGSCFCECLIVGSIVL